MNEPQSAPTSSGIYAISNTINGKQYIGSAVNIARRWAEHRYDLTKGIHHASHLQHAWDKYGADAFTFTVLEVVIDVACLIEREQFYMDVRFTACGNIGYNSRPIAESNRGHRHSAASRRKMSQRLTGRRITWRDKLRGPKSEEHRHKLSENAKARRWSEEHKRRISETMKGRPNNARLTELSRETRRQNIKACWTPEAIAKRDAAIAARRASGPTEKQLAYWRTLSEQTAQRNRDRATRQNDNG